MSEKTSVSLGKYFDAFIEDQIASGKFASASDVIQAGLRLLEERESKLKRLREMIRQGDESGEPIPLDRRKFFAEMQAEHRAKNG